MKRGFVKLLWLILLASTIGIVIIIFYPQPENEPNGIEIDKTRYPITGIDVSRHTGKIDFGKLKEQYADTIDFVYIKATEGISMVDKNFASNYSNARQHEIPVGAYHFFKFNVDGDEQAKNYLQTIKNKSLDLPLVLDIEEWSNSRNVLQDKVIKEIGNFIAAIERRRKEKLMIYTNESSFQKYIQGNFDSTAIWICSFSEQPKIQNDWTLWQHSHKGKLDGAEGWVDINTFNGSREDWSRFLKKSN
jgi:lysozyme